MPDNAQFRSNALAVILQTKNAANNKLEHHLEIN